MKPSIGRIVHFKDPQSIVYPAIVTNVEGDDLTLTVFDNSQTTAGVKTSSMGIEGTSLEIGQWCWPPRV